MTSGSNQRSYASGSMSAAAERRLPRRFSPDDVAGQLDTGVAYAPTFYVSASSSATRISHQLVWLTTWGYLSDVGHFGCGRYPQTEGKSGDVDLVAELRAVWNAIRQPVKAGPLVVVIHSAAVAYQMVKWKAGSTDMPPGYVGSAHRPPMLEKLRRVLALHGSNLTIRPGATRGLLDQGAAELATLAGLWSEEDRAKDSVRQQATELAEAFVRGRR